MTEKILQFGWRFAQPDRGGVFLPEEGETWPDVVTFPVWEGLVPFLDKLTSYYPTRRVGGMVLWRVVSAARHVLIESGHEPDAAFAAVVYNLKPLGGGHWMVVLRLTNGRYAREEVEIE